MPAGRIRSILAIVLSLPLVVAAQTGSSTASGTIAGVVYAPDGRPLSGVQVIVGSPDRQARTDAEGRWRVTGLAPGTHRLVARRVGFVPARRTLTIIAGGAPLSIVDTLTYTGVRLDATVIAARRQSFPGTLERVERGASVVAFAEDIAAIPTNLYDIDALLWRSAPLRGMSAFTRGKPPACRFIREGAAVLVDGRPVPESMPLRDWVGPYDIELFEISRGAAVVQDDHRRRAAGDTTGPRIDRRIGGCPWVWLIWTKDYTRRRDTAM